MHLAVSRDLSLLFLVYLDDINFTHRFPYSMHHGYYVPEDRTDHVQAQIDLIDEVLKWAGVDDGKAPKKVVDVGCGIGGSSRHIAKKYGCTAQGITLSPYEANRGNELAKEQGLSDRASFQVSKRLEDYSIYLRWQSLCCIPHHTCDNISALCIAHQEYLRWQSLFCIPHNIYHQYFSLNFYYNTGC